MARVELGIGDTSQEYANDMIGLSIGSLLAGRIDEDWCTATYAYVFYPPYPEPGEEPDSYFALGGFGFTYSGTRIVGGTVTQAGEAEDGQLVYRITGLNLSARQVYDWMAAGNSAALLNAVLAGDDVIEGNINKDRLIGLAGRDEIHGRGGDDWLEGGAGDDRLFGGLNNDKLFGGADNDTFAAAVTAGEFDFGNDIYDGGAGLDTVEYRLAAAAVNVDLHAGTATDGSGGADTLISVENAIGSANADRILGSSRAGEMDNHLQGLGGNDVLGGEAGRDTIDGGAGTDTADYFLASAGVDVDLQVFGFQDTLGAGVDSLISIENLRGSHFADSLVGNQGVNTLSGGIGGDTLVGMGGADRLEGEDGADFLIGVNPDGSASGQDVLVGGAGSDFYLVDAGDRVTEFAADDDAVVFQTAHPVGRTMVHVNTDGSRDIRAYDATFTTFTSARLDSVAAGTRFEAEIYNGENGSGVMLTRAAGPVTVFDEISYNGSAAFAEADLQFTGMMDFGLNLYAGLLSPAGAAKAGPSNPDDPQGIIEPITLGLAIGFLAIAIDRKVVKHFGSWGALDQELGASARVKGLAEAATKILLLGYSPGERLEVAIEHPQKNWWDPWADGVKGDAPQNGSGMLALVTPEGDTQVGFDILKLAMTNDRLEFQRLIMEAAQEDAAAIQAVREGREQPRSDPNGDETLINAGGRNIDAGGGDDAVHWVSFGVRGAPPEVSAAPGEAPQSANDGNQILNGGTGQDTLIYLADTQGVDVQLGLNGGNGRATGAAIGTDTITDFENVWGGAGNDVLRGNQADNHLLGGGGDDRIIHYSLGGDHDVYDGGAGIDTADFRGYVGVTIDLLDNSRNSTGSGAGFSNFDLTLISIENLIGTNLADNLYGNDADNTFMTVEWAVGQAKTTTRDVVDGRGGNDTVSFADREGPIHSSGISAYRLDNQPGGTVIGALSMTSVENWIGSRFGDSLSGTNVANRIDGAAGNDELWGYGGDDILIGGDGVDQFDGGDGWDMAVIGGTVAVTVDMNAARDSSGWVTWSGERFRSIEAVVGGSGADRFTGSTGDDYLDGASGANIISGGAGNDRLFGQGTLNGGDGADVIKGSLTASGVMHGDAGDDLISGQGSLFGDAGNDTIDGATGADVLDGGDGADILRGGAGDDSLNGGAGIDRLEGGDGRDTVIFGASATAVAVDLAAGTARGADGLADILVSIENASGGAGNDTLSGSAEANTLNGGAGNDALTGLGGSDILQGSVGDDGLDGGAGDDTLTGGAGADTLNGGDGMDTATFNGLRSGYVISTSAGVTTVSGPDGVDTLRGVERLQFSDGFFTPEGAPFPTTVNGTAGADVLVGTTGVNNITAGAGDDTITGLQGNDTIDGGAGIDTAVFAGLRSAYTVSTVGATTTVSGPDGVDTLTTVERLRFDDMTLVVGAGGGQYLGGTNAAETLAGAGFADEIEGFGGSDTLNGGDGDDVLRGGAGVDVLNGGAGIDTADYSTAAGAVNAQLNANRSTNDGDGGTDTFTGVENLTGSAFNDTLIGDGGANVLRGGLGSDTLLGLAGNDVLWGGSGALNALQGGLGDDTYVLEAADSVFEAAGEGTDTVDARIGTYVLAVNVENLIFGGVGNFTGTGNAAANVMTGGAGDDVLRGRGGADVMNGGSGTDTADYTLAAAATVIRLDLQRATNDGDGATDTFTSVENAIGSNYNDVIYGDANANVIQGGIGSDVLVGGGGNDILMGGSGGVNNQLQGGTGDDLYILDAFDTIVELAGEGIDTVQARVGSYTLGNNVENLFYTGPGSFVGSGNALNNTITGGALDDILRGGGGNDTINGGLGSDELQLRGVAANYTITAEGAGWRIVDSVAGRDGSTFVTSIEVLRYANNTTTTLTYGAPAPLEPAAKDGEMLVLPTLVDDGLVLPAIADDQPLVLPGAEALKFADEPLVLPGADETGPLFLGLEARLEGHQSFFGDWMMTLDPDGQLAGLPAYRENGWF
ncbi:Ca2+-binding RTX toxin-like protein [Brevundimonas alba]|uniref:Ca2+-binding RTX toxin-like protein n=1 Tax=Brevundimonas alba TaxID=74314 RepID=A0A7X5YHH3_9CAUL|nr:hypothetical protein [Brevundimonas alba]NJC39794.1 Ca2+-binding RTX toxin-like protein [Brevundimonas alba]